MERVTVEDCIDKIPNRYELLMVATQRARYIGRFSDHGFRAIMTKTR